jgi:hypothetical protein
VRSPSAGAPLGSASIARLQASGYFAVATIRTLFETTFFAGLRKDGLPEE